MKNLLAVVVLLFGVLTSYAQPLNQNKLVMPSISWTETYQGFSPDISSARYTFSQDTVQFLQHNYRELLVSEEEIGNNFVGTLRYFREEENKVYEYVDNSERLMYDFNLQVQDTFHLEERDIILETIDTITLVNGEKRALQQFNCDGNGVWPVSWIEGIGSELGFEGVYYSCYTDIGSGLQCYYRNDTLLYMRPGASACWIVGTNDIVLPTTVIQPNPSKDFITIKSDTDYDEVNFLTPFGLATSKKNSSTIDIAALHPGLYIVLLKRHGKVMARTKLVKVE